MQQRERQEGSGIWHNVNTKPPFVKHFLIYTIIGNLPKQGGAIKTAPKHNNIKLLRNKSGKDENNQSYFICHQTKHGFDLSRGALRRITIQNMVLASNVWPWFVTTVLPEHTLG